MKSTNRTIHTAEIAVIGTGIHGVHIATCLVESGVTAPSRLVTIDPWESPLRLWERRVRNCGMDFLRSPGSHGLSADLQALRGTLTEARDSTPPYRRPSVERFREHCLDRVDRYLSGVPRVRATAEDICTGGPPGNDRGDHYRIAVRGRRGESGTVFARAVVICPGNPPPNMPSALQPARQAQPDVTRSTRVHHVHHTDFDPDRIVPGDRVMIVGGGIAALNLALALLDRRVQVTVRHRDPITVHQFDSDPCFIGPRCGELFESVRVDETRTTMIRRSRRSGSVPPDLMASFRRAVAAGRCAVEHRNVRGIRQAGRRLVAVGTDCIENEEFDHVIACTGFRDEPPAAELILRTAENLKLPLTGTGYPVLSRELSWAPGLYVSGGLADYVLGPPARNIIGAHLARRRIMPAIESFLSS